MIGGLNISIPIFVRGDAGVPSTTQYGNIPSIEDVVTSYEHSIAATVGFESMTVGMVVSVDTAMDWLTDGLLRSTSVYGPDGETLFEGFVNGVSATFGQEQRSVALDGMANRVRVRYTTVLGTPGSTSQLSNTTSQAIYGIKDAVYSLGGSTATAATNLATAILAARAWPVSSPASAIGTGDLGDVQVQLSFVGWYVALDWVTTSSTSTTSTATTTQVTSLLTAYNAVNTFFSTDATNIAASGISDTEYISPDTTYRGKIEELLKQGNSSNNRLAWGIYEGRALTVAEWAGATPSTVTYYRSFGDAVIRDSGGGVVQPWNVRPNAMYQTDELLDVQPVSTAPDSAGRYFVERVTFHADASGISLSLEPQASDSIDARLARMGE